jgi:hypothetical protein
MTVPSHSPLPLFFAISDVFELPTDSLVGTKGTWINKEWDSAEVFISYYRKAMYSPQHPAPLSL